MCYILFYARVPSFSNLSIFDAAGLRMTFSTSAVARISASAAAEDISAFLTSGLCQYFKKSRAHYKQAERLSHCLATLVAVAGQR